MKNYLVISISNSTEKPGIASVREVIRECKCVLAREKYFVIPFTTYKLKKTTFV